MGAFFIYKIYTSDDVNILSLDTNSRIIGRVELGRA